MKTRFLLFLTLLSGLFLSVNGQNTVTCSAPSNVEVLNISGTSATISWDAVTSASWYYVQYRKTSQTYWYTATTSTTSKLLYNLNDTTAYEYKVRSYCGAGNYSDYTEVDTFYTTSGSSSVSCSAPGNITVSSINQHTATISWDAVPGVMYYYIKYKKTSDNYWYTSATSSTSRILYSLSDTTEYEFKLQSYCGYGIYGSFSAVDTFTTLASGNNSGCDAPANITVSNISSNSATISWDAVPGVFYYYIQYKDVTSSYWYTAVSSSTTRNLTYLSDTSMYEFKVRSYCGYGQYGAYSPVDTFITLSNANGGCGVPTNVAISSVTFNGAVLSWDPVPGAYYYYIQYRKDNQSYWYSTSSSTTNKSLSWLSDTTSYELKLRSYCGYGDYSAYSDTITFTTLSNSNAGCDPPASIIVDNLTQNTATLSWSAVAGAMYYYIQYKKLNDTYWSTSYSSNTSRVLYNLDDSTAYEYKIRSYCGYGVYGDYSVTDTLVTLSNTSNSSCPPPGNIAVNSVTNNTAMISWDAVSGVSYYYIKYRVIGTSYWYTNSSTTTSKMLAYLSDSTSYEFRIQSYCGAGAYGDLSLVQTFTTLNSGGNSGCDAPTNITVDNLTQNSATISWDAVTSVMYYYIKYKKISDSNWSTYASSQTSRTIYGLSDSTSYEFKIQSYCGYGVYGSFSAVDTFTTMSLPNTSTCLAPVNILVNNVTQNSATISWDAVAGVSYYYIKYKKVSDSYWYTSSTNQTSRILSGLSDSTSYDFKIQSYCGYGVYGSFSTVNSFTTLSNPAASACLAPTNITVDNITQNSATISWDPVQGISYYYIKYKKLSDSYWTTYSSSQTSRTIYNLSDSTSYEFKLQSYCGSGVFGYFSQADTFTTMGSGGNGCTAPGNITIDVLTNSSVTISWDAVAGVMYYYIKYKKVNDTYWYTNSSSQTTRTITGLDDSTTYEFKLQSYCGSGIYGDFSPVDTFTTFNSSGSATCDAPSNITVDALTNYSATISWDAVPGISYYYIKYRKLTNTYWYTSSSSSTSRTITGLSDTSAYEFKLQSYCGNGVYGAFSSVDTFITFSSANSFACAYPSNISVSAISSTSATISWDVSPGSTYYYVKYKKSTDTWWSTASSSTNSRTLTYLSPGSDYSYFIYSYCSGMNPYYSDSSAVASFTTPASKEIESSGLSQKEILIYPNPSKGIINVKAGAMLYQSIEIMDMQSRVLAQFDRNEDDEYILTSLRAGLYIIRINGAQGKMITKKIVIQ